MMKLASIRRLRSSTDPARLALVSIALALCSGPASSDELRFGPARGSLVEKTLRYDHELEVLQITRTTAGVPTSDAEVGGWVRGHQIYLVADRYEDVEPARVRSLLREYRTCAGSSAATLKGFGREGRHLGVDFFTPLRGQVVRFTWIEGARDHARMYETLDAPETYLARLKVDMDLLRALPAGPVEVGDSWELDAEKQRSLLTPGGDLLIWPSKVGNAFTQVMQLPSRVEMPRVVDKWCASLPSSSLALTPASSSWERARVNAAGLSAAVNTKCGRLISVRLNAADCFFHF